MIPQLFSIGPLPINTFGLMVALAILSGMHLLRRSFIYQGLDGSKAETYVFIGGVSGLLGSRLWHLFEHWREVLRSPIEMIFSSAGFTFYGGFLFASLVLYLFCRRDKFPVTRFMDACGPTLALGYAIGRLGCQLSGDGDYGKFTDSIFGMSYLTGVVPTPPGFFAYPTPLYESTLCFLILWGLLRVETSREWDAPLSRFGLYLSLVATSRFFVEYLRINPEVVGSLSQAQIISIVLALLGTWLVFRKRNAGARIS